MKLRDQYDWIVLGDHPGALLSASLAAKLGLSVLLLPLGESQGLWISADDDVLDPESNWLLGYGGEEEGEPGLLGECLKRLGIAGSERELFQADGSVPQALTPGFRVALFHEQPRFQGELEREWGKRDLDRLGVAPALSHSRAPIQRFWAKLPERLTIPVDPPGTKPGTGSAKKQNFFSSMKRGVGEPLTLDQLSHQLGRKLPKGQQQRMKPWFSRDARLKRFTSSVKTAAFGEFFQSAWSSATGSLAHPEAGLFDLLHLIALTRTGSSFRGGMVAYRDFLLRLARRNGADLPAKVDCRRIFVENGKFAGVLPTGRGSMIAGTGAVLGCPLSRAQGMMTTSGRRWGLRSARSHVLPIGWKFSIALSLHPEAVPPGVSRRMVYQEQGAPFIELELSRHTEYGLKDRHRALLFARTLMPMTEESLKPQYQRMVAARMLRKMTEIHPFLEFHITRIFPDFRTEDERELRETFGFESLQTIPHNLLCYSGKGAGAHSGVEGLFLSSGESFPELGSFGGVVSAMEGVAWLAHRAGLAGPLK